MNRDVLTIAGLNVTFGGIKAVSGLNLALERGQRLGVIGPNGAGKTSLLNAISRLVPATGRLTYDAPDGEVELLDKRSFQLARIGIARTFQMPQLLGDFTVAQNIALGAYGTSVRHRDLGQSVPDLIQQCGLELWADTPVGDATHGVRKVTEIARALLIQPALLMLDEPGAGASPPEKAAIVDALRTMPSDTTVIVIDHDIDMVTELAHSIVVLDFGKLVASGPPDVVLDDPDVLSSYFGISESTTNTP